MTTTSALDMIRNQIEKDLSGDLVVRTGGRSVGG